MKSRRKSKLIGGGTIILLAGGFLGLLSTLASDGFAPSFDAASSVSPTITYFESFPANYMGVYHYVRAVPVCRTGVPPCLASDQFVFYLSAKNGTVQLVFFCGVAGNHCDNPSQVPFADGACLRVRGTLEKPPQ
jgi:hypothetical protein